MKNVSFCLGILLLFAASCSKSGDVADPQNGNFTITGVRDVDLSVSSTGSYTFPVTVTSNSGGKDAVSLTADLVPGGVYANFQPRTGVTPFTSQVTISTDYTTGGGTFPFKIKGVDSIGSRTYDIHVTLDAFRGWQFGTDVFSRESIEENPGTTSQNPYPYIKVNGPNGAQLRISFAAGAGLPKVNSTYNVSKDTGAKNIQITMYNSTQIWSATGQRTDGVGIPTGTFTFDTLHKFTFKCNSVQMSDGLNKKNLNCSFSE